MPRILFKKTGNAVWMSHLDLMRLFQRAFKRAGLQLTHTQGFNPRPSVSIALPLSVGTQSYCELLDFELNTQTPVENSEIGERLNKALVDGVEVLHVYNEGRKLRELMFMGCRISLDYDSGVADGTPETLKQLFSTDSLIVEKKSKNGTQEQDIIPMIQTLNVYKVDDQKVIIEAVVRCQNPALNPAQLINAIERYQPDFIPNSFQILRIDLYDEQEKIFR